MSIKAGAILHDANGFTIDRIQSGGVSNLNINEEKIYELGNWESIGITRDVPDLSFDMESFDMTCEPEAVLTNQDPLTINDGDEFDFIDSVPIDVISPYKLEKGLYTIEMGIIVPYLVLEQVTYRFGVRQNATEQFTLRGDAQYFAKATPYYEEFTGDGGTTAFTLAHAADVTFAEAGNTIRVLGACYIRSNGTYKRLFYGSGNGYTDSSTQVIFDDAPPSGAKIKVVYFSSEVATYPQSIHPSTGVKPAAVRSQHIDVYIGTSAATPVFSRKEGVQSIEVTRRVNLDNDEELGNAHYVNRDYDVADVTGTLNIKPADVEAFIATVAELADVSVSEVIGPNTSSVVPVEIRVRHPDTGDTIKTLYIPDARFQPPATQGRVQQKLEVPFPFTSQSGTLLVYAGER